MRSSAVSSIRLARLRYSGAIHAALALVVGGALLFAGCDSGGSLGDDDETGPPASVAIELADDATLVVDSTVAVTGRVTDDEGRPVDQTVVRWSAPGGNGTVEPGTTTTDENGEVTTEWTLGPDATGPNAQGVQASVGNDLTETLEVDVNPGPVAGLVLEAASQPVDIGETTTATVTGLEDVNGNPVSGLSQYTFSWSSVDTTLASVTTGTPTSEATVKGRGTGTARIAVATGAAPGASAAGIRKANGATADTLSVSIRHPVQQLAIELDSAVVAEDSTTTAALTTLTDAAGSDVQDRSKLTFSWSSVDPPTASVAPNSPATSATVTGEQHGRTGIVLSVTAAADAGAMPSPRPENTVTDTVPVDVQRQELRGVWITNVDSDVLDSEQNIEEAMAFLDRFHFNVVFPVVWNKAATTYRSTVMDTLIGRPIAQQYQGRDPLRELIDAAHEHDIAVIPWFEYGFASSFSSGGGPILQEKPSWAAKDQNGDLLTKNGFEWLNPYKPAVRDFMSDLIMEVVRNYDVDGVQGDDRLPAHPVEGGYSSFTKNLYNQQTGQNPPSNESDPDWMRWRADILNSFGQRIHDQVKAHDPNMLVSWAPSIWQFSFQEYLQDWPTWINDGYTDLIHPQVYRRDVPSYRAALNAQAPSRAGWDESKVLGFYPGILLKVGGYVATPEDITDMVEANRERGYNGEVYFFYEGFREFDADVAKALKDSLYKNPAPLPFRRASAD